MTTINVKNLSRSFGKTPILKDISLQAEDSTIYGLAGLNGAGKTTLIRILLGILRKDGGSVEVCGFDPWLHQQEYYRIIGAALESDGFFGNLSIMDNLKIFAEAKKVKWEDAEKYLNDYWRGTDIFSMDMGTNVGADGNRPVPVSTNIVDNGNRLAPVTPKKVKYLSRGQRVQCGLCRAFLGWPRICFLDEPTVSLDIKAYEHLKYLVREAKSRGSTILISSHQLELIDDLCDRVGLLRDGHLEELNKGDRKFSDVIKDIYRYYCVFKG
jgi:ABC-2 type transport system ATP-binding protein